MFHHAGVFASDLAASRRFYAAVLAPLGIVLGYETAVTAEFWHHAQDTPSLSLEAATDAATTGLHLAFAASSRDQVDRFHAAALEAGATSRHAPRFWPEYRAYTAFVDDPDGNNIEALHKQAEGA